MHLVCVSRADVISVSKATCAARLSYFEQLLITLLVFKVMVALALFGSFIAPKVVARYREYMRWRGIPKHLRLQKQKPTRRNTIVRQVCSRRRLTRVVFR